MVMLVFITLFMISTINAVDVSSHTAYIVDDKIVCKVEERIMRHFDEFSWYVNNTKINGTVYVRDYNHPNGTVNKVAHINATRVLYNAYYSCVLSKGQVHKYVISVIVLSKWNACVFSPTVYIVPILLCAFWLIWVISSTCWTMKRPTAPPAYEELANPELKI